MFFVCVEEKNISGPSFPPRKKRRPLRTHTYVAPKTETLLVKPPQKPRTVQEQPNPSSVFDRLAKSSTISFSKKMNHASEQQRQSKSEKAKEQPRTQHSIQHQLEESPSKETVSERIARLEKACLDYGNADLFTKKDTKQKKSIDLATALRRPVPSNISSLSPPPPPPPPRASPPKQHQSLYHELNAVKTQVEPTAIPQKNTFQSPKHDQAAKQRRSLLDELKAFQQHHQEQHSNSSRHKSMAREPSPTHQSLRADPEPSPVRPPLLMEHEPLSINERTPSIPMHSNHDAPTDQAYTLEEQNHQENASLEITSRFFNSFLTKKDENKAQKEQSIETTQDVFKSVLNKDPETTHQNTHQPIDKQIDNTPPQRKFTDFSDTYQRIKQLREQIRQVSQPRSRNELMERKRTREYQGAHFIDERIKRARKVLKASKEKRRKNGL